MGGGDGGVIVRDGVGEILKNPEVHGLLPATITGNLDPVLAKDSSSWGTHEKHIVAKAAEWALLNL
jgi:hypothetical protein